MTLLGHEGGPDCPPHVRLPDHVIFIDDERIGRYVSGFCQPRTYDLPAGVVLLLRGYTDNPAALGRCRLRLTTAEP